MIHSVLRRRPDRPRRPLPAGGLANGAFAFFGSMNEPYLDGVPDPLGSSSTLMTPSGLPLVVAALRQTLPGETFRASPGGWSTWATPLYRLRARSRNEPVDPARLPSWEPTEGMARGLRGPSAVLGRSEDDQAPASAGPDGRPPSPEARRSDEEPTPPGDDLVETLLGEIRRQGLPAGRLPPGPSTDSSRSRSCLQGQEARPRFKARTSWPSPTSDRSPGDSAGSIETILTTDFHLSARAAGRLPSGPWTAGRELMKTRDPTSTSSEQATSPCRPIGTFPDRLRQASTDGAAPLRAQYAARGD